jgi:glucokinase
MSRTIAVGDVGGTHARFALAKVANGGVVSLGDPVVLKTANHASFELAWQEFGRIAAVELPEALGLAIAGPVGAEVLELTNYPWAISPNSLREQLGVNQHKIVNDLGAVAHSVAQFGPENFDHLCGPDGTMPERGVTTIVGLGTGLGVAQLLKTSENYHVIETEGGHIDFAPLDDLEDELLARLRRRFGRVSVERIASGSGLINLYDAIASIEGQAMPNRDGEGIWAAAVEGSDPLAVTALDRFLLALGAVAGDLALAQGSTAVVISGGLSYRLKDRFATSSFADRFIAKGRFERRMKSIPIKLVNHPQPGLYGAAAAFAKDFA